MNEQKNNSATKDNSVTSPKPKTPETKYDDTEHEEKTTPSQTQQTK